MKSITFLFVASFIALIVTFQSIACELVHQDSIEMEEIEVEKEVEKYFFLSSSSSNLHKVEFDDSAAFVLCTQTLLLSSIFVEVDTPPPEMFS